MFRISLLQSPLYWEEPGMNRSMFEWKVRDLAGEADLIVLPEMFTSGFTMNAERVAEVSDGPTVAWMQELARETGAAITGSAVIRDGERHVNRLLWVEPEGRVLHYDKRHLFGLAGEHEHYAAGEERLLVEWRGLRICPLVCYDLRFPVWSRNTENYDLLLYVANWPEARRRHWQQLLIARAIENQAWVAGVNRIGHDAAGLAYAGDTMLVGFDGEVLLSAAHAETTLSASLLREQLLGYRERLPFLRDRDAFRLV